MRITRSSSLLRSKYTNMKKNPVNIEDDDDFIDENLEYTNSKNTFLTKTDKININTYMRFKVGGKTRLRRVTMLVIGGSIGAKSKVGDGSAILKSKVGDRDAVEDDPYLRFKADNEGYKADIRLFPPTSFMANDNLCGPPPTSCSESKRQQKKQLSNTAAAGIVVAIVFTTTLICLYLLYLMLRIWCKWKQASISNVDNRDGGIDGVPGKEKKWKQAERKRRPSSSFSIYDLLCATSAPPPPLRHPRVSHSRFRQSLPHRRWCPISKIKRRSLLPSSSISTFTTPQMTFGHSREKRTATLTIFEVAEGLRGVTNRNHITTPSNK
ncbi:hypothetical protein LXL04_034393 [Taraxacum kok-saghyz]